MRRQSGAQLTDMASKYPATNSGTKGQLFESISRNWTLRWLSTHWSTDRETGMCRLTLTGDDAHVRAWLIDQGQTLERERKIDQMGNIFIRRQGKLRSAAPMTAMRSHLDTQPRGGRYDGILSVLAELEVLRTFQGHDFVSACGVRRTSDSGDTLASKFQRKHDLKARNPDFFLWILKIFQSLCARWNRIALNKNLSSSWAKI